MIILMLLLMNSINKELLQIQIEHENTKFVFS